MDTDETIDTTEPIVATFLIRVTLRGDQPAPTNAEVQNRLSDLFASDGHTVRVTSERVDK